MIRRVLCTVLAASLGAGGARAQSGSDNELLRSVDQVLGRGDHAPTIDEILGDTLERIRAVDGMSVRAAAGRLKETESELRLYESLLKQVRAGLLVEIPRSASASPAPTPEEVSAERSRVEQLSGQLEAAERELTVRSQGLPPKPASPLVATAMADALLDVVVQIPEAPAGRDARGARDPANLSRALFVAGDFPGTLEALNQIPPEKLTPEHQLRRARALDQLGRLSEAKAAYEAVVASDGNGPLGRQASWMLKLTRTREQVASATGSPDSRPGRERGERKK